MKKFILPAMLLLTLFPACHTATSFIIPPNTELMVNGERLPADVKHENGRIDLVTRPFFWTSMSGIDYVLLQGDKVIKKDRLPSSFRIVSIFWPPYAYIYWPIGFRFPCYDLLDPKKEFVEKCAKLEEPAKEAAPVSPMMQ